MGKFIVELHTNGVMRKTWDVASYKAAAGIWDGDWPHLPANAQVIEGLPYQYRKAFERGVIWLAKGGLCDVAYCELYRARDNAPMGTLFARYSKAGAA